ncbi:MAG TPA: hypothetical protein VFC00_30650 [Micromonosporaceae bacterium]|nr:hypothetical protein [Micromonosporaceae bacterium]
MTTPGWQPPPDLAAQLQDLYGLTCPPRWGPPRRLHYPTLGHGIARVMTELGTPPMPHQKYMADVALEVDPKTGILAYRKVGLSIPRQQGKTQKILAAMIHRIRAWPRQNVKYAAQTRIMARERWEDEFLVAMEQAKPMAGKFRARKGNGNEAIIWSKTRSKLGIVSNTEKAGHGPPLDLGMIDESFAHIDARLEQAFTPAMATRPMAQLWWASAGGTEASIWLNEQRERGREQIEALWRSGLALWPSQAYFEWFAPDDLDRDDPETWFTCMPALCRSETVCTCDPAGEWRHTVTIATIRADKSNLEPEEFDRAYLNRTRKKLPPPDPNVPAKEWPGRADASSKVGTDITIAVDITPLREAASIAVYGLREDGIGHVELIDHRPGTDWVVARLVQLRERHHPVAIALDAKGPAGSLLVDLSKLDPPIAAPKDAKKPQRGDLAIPTMIDVAAACGQFADAVRQGTLRHIDQVQLNVAMGGARSRPLGDAWAWARKAAEVDISPLVAVTLARWAYVTRAELVDLNHEQPFFGAWR